MAVSKQAGDDYKAGLKDADKSAIGQVATDVAVAHPDTKPYYDARESKPLDEDKKDEGGKPPDKKAEEDKRENEEQDDPDSDKDKD